jgi:hypothetical protein
MSAILLLTGFSVPQSVKALSILTRQVPLSLSSLWSVVLDAKNIFQILVAHSSFLGRVRQRRLLAIDSADVCKGPTRNLEAKRGTCADRKDQNKFAKASRDCALPATTCTSWLSRASNLHGGRLQKRHNTLIPLHPISLFSVKRSQLVITLVSCKLKFPLFCSSPPLCLFITSTCKPTTGM